MKSSMSQAETCEKPSVNHILLHIFSMGKSMSVLPVLAALVAACGGVLGSSNNPTENVKIAASYCLE